MSHRPISFSWRMSANNFPFFFCSRHWPPPRRRTGIGELISQVRYPSSFPLVHYHRHYCLRPFYQSVTIICNRAIARNRCLDIINVDIQNVRHDRNINWGNLPAMAVCNTFARKKCVPVNVTRATSRAVWSGLNKIIHRKQSNSNSPDRIFILTPKSSTPVLLILLSLAHQFFERGPVAAAKML